MRKTCWPNVKKPTHEVEMQMELYFRPNCGFSRSVINSITNLKIGDKIVLKNLLEEPEYENELVQLCGNGEVPTLVVDGKPMRGSEDIKKLLVDNFFD